MAISSINIQPATAHCFAHNDRSDKVTYLIDSSKENECSASASVAQKALAQMISEAKKYRKDNGLRAMKSDTVKAVEAVVNLNAGHTLKDVQVLAGQIEKEFGFRAVQIAIHRDEGKSVKDKNYHAHIVMCNITPEGKTIQRTLGRDGLKKLQDITASELGMERGKSSNAKHVDHKIYRATEQEKEKLLEKIDVEQEKTNKIKERWADDKKSATELARELGIIAIENPKNYAVVSLIPLIKAKYQEDRKQYIAEGNHSKADYDALKKERDEHIEKIKELDLIIKNQQAEIAALKASKEQEHIKKEPEERLKEENLELKEQKIELEKTIAELEKIDVVHGQLTGLIEAGATIEELKQVVQLHRETYRIKRPAYVNAKTRAIEAYKSKLIKKQTETDERLLKSRDDENHINSPQAFRNL